METLNSLENFIFYITLNGYFEVNKIINLVISENLLKYEILSLVLITFFTGIIYLGLKIRAKKIVNLFDIHEYIFEPLKLSEKIDFYLRIPNLSANGISRNRIIGSIILNILMFIYYENLIISSILFGFFFLLMITDLLDGEVSRAKNNKTIIGEWLDTLADKVLLLPMLFIVTYNSNLLEILLPISIGIILFDIIGTSLRNKSNNKSAKYVGKLKTAIMPLSIYLISLERFGEQTEVLSISLLSLTAILAFFSMYSKIQKIGETKTPDLIRGLIFY